MLSHRSEPQLGEVRLATVIAREDADALDGQSIGIEWTADANSCVCEHCLEDGHDEQGLSIERANGQDRGEYRITHCDGGVWLCDRHLAEASRAAGVTPQFVVFGDREVRSGHWDALVSGAFGTIAKAKRREPAAVPGETSSTG